MNPFLIPPVPVPFQKHAQRRIQIHRQIVGEFSNNVDSCSYLIKLVVMRNRALHRDESVEQVLISVVQPCGIINMSGMGYQQIRVKKG